MSGLVKSVVRNGCGTTPRVKVLVVSCNCCGVVILAGLTHGVHFGMLGGQELGRGLATGQFAILVASSRAGWWREENLRG